MANYSAKSEKVVIAVDFGTTFSGVAWALMSNPDRHHVINHWPRTKAGPFDGMTSEKVPNSMPRIQWINLGLAPDQKDKSGSRLSSAYNDSRENPVPHHSSPEQVATDYLRHSREHIVDTLKTQILSLLDAKNLQFVLTVPAIWPEKAKVATLHCAQEAGFGQASEI